ncbi:MAG: zinc-finger domain-containing protein [Pseudomonadota bacterium]
MTGGTVTSRSPKSVKSARCPEDKPAELNNAPGSRPTITRYKNDIGIWKIYIGQKQFVCIGASAPHDHPHIYLQMGDTISIICSYCATHYSYLHELGDDSDPAGCVEMTAN